jgi:hypothetical protein
MPGHLDRARNYRRCGLRLPQPLGTQKIVINAHRKGRMSCLQPRISGSGEATIHIMANEMNAWFMKQGTTMVTRGRSQ